MKKVYLVCTRSAITASALTYIINQSPDFYNLSHNNLWLEEHSEWFGVAHIINDWWNVSDQLRAGYDPEFRNTIELTRDQLHKLVDTWNASPSNKNICLFTHARNTEDIIRIAAEDNLPIVVITTCMGPNSHHFIEAFLKREYNDEMNDYEDFHSAWKYIYYQLTAQDNYWREHYDYNFEMRDWLHTPEIIYSTLGVAPCVDMHLWTDQYRKFNNAYDMVEFTTAHMPDSVIKRLQFLTYVFNTYTAHEKNTSLRIKFAILLYQSYNNQDTASIEELVDYVAKTIGLELTNVS